MNQDENNRIKEADQNRQWVVPQCCIEGWDSCPHVINRDKKEKKRNIGL